MKVITIGREGNVPVEQARLAVMADGKTGFIGAPGSVPASVSRNHCKITIDDEGGISIAVSDPDNLLYIGGKSYARRSGLQRTDVICLGADRYRLNLSDVFELVPQPKITLSVKHLKEVYAEVAKTRKDLKAKQRRIAFLSKIPGVFSMASLLVTFAFDGSTEPGKTIRTVLYVIAFLTMVACIIWSTLSAKNMEDESERLNETFREKCVCPNPSCERFLGQTYPTYKDLIRYHVCPHCRTQFKE